MALRVGCCIFLIYISTVHLEQLPDFLAAQISPHLLPQKSTTNKKLALRYGFHRTKECQDFEIAFLCITKCLDLRYDVAVADKECKCKCYNRKDKAKYKPIIAPPSKFHLGAPTTTKPAWAVPVKEALSNVGMFSSEDSKDSNESSRSEENVQEGKTQSTGDQEAVTSNIGGVNSTDAVVPGASGNDTAGAPAATEAGAGSPAATVAA